MNGAMKRRKQLAEAADSAKSADSQKPQILNYRGAAN